MSKATRAIATPARGASPSRPFYPLYRYDIETALGLAEAFGGIVGLSEYTGSAPEAVKAWTISGRIPNGWHLRLFGKAVALGNTVNPIIFGFEADADEAQALNRLMFPRMGGDDE